MSVQRGLWCDGADGVGTNPVAGAVRASLAREMRYLLTISTESRRAGQLSPSGLAHSLGVCLIEDFNMARGKGKSGDAGNGAAMPRFVDIKLSQEQKAEFLRTHYTVEELLTFLQSAADDGYRVGCAWNGESQAYTVSMTGRAEGNPNNGLCMTSFAKDMLTAIGLVCYKHTVVCDENWLGAAGPESADFG